jgi:hypothetical protein
MDKNEETKRGTTPEHQESQNVKAVGKLLCTVTLNVLPDNWSIKVTSFTAVIPPGNNGWYAVNNGPTPPYTPKAGGSIASCYLSSTNLSDSGTGPSAIYGFQVTTDKGIVNTGTLTLGSSAWGYVTRPDQIYLTFDFNNDSNPPQTILMAVPDLLDPDPFSLGFGEDSNGDTGLDPILSVGQSPENLVGRET